MVVTVWGALDKDGRPGAVYMGQKREPEPPKLCILDTMSL